MINRFIRSLAAVALLATNVSAFSVVYVRHAQGGHNVKADYDRLAIPASERPAWVGDADRFTPLGETQRVVLAESLRDVPFDLIACSPVWRTRQTILPFLKASGRKAELWPELAEASYIGDSAAARAGQFDASVFLGISPIELSEEEKPYFSFRSDTAGSRWMLATNAPQAAALALRVEEMLRARFSGTDQRVLLVGHGTAGLTLVRILANDKTIGPRHMDNTHVWKLDARDAGPIRILYHNESADRIRREP